MSQKKTTSRADKVRERRKKQGYENVAEMPIYEPVEPFRPSKATSFIGPKKRNNQKRTFEMNTAILPQPRTVSLARPTVTFPSIERQMPSIEWRAVSAFIVILLAVVLYLMWTLPYFLVSAPQISGSVYLAGEAITESLDVEGISVFSLQPEKLERELLLAHPILKTVEITVRMPNHVRVSVTERQPVLIWKQDGKMAWIDDEGVAFQAEGHSDQLIVVNALGRPPAPAMDATELNPWAPPAYLDPNVVAALRALVPYVPQGAAITYDPNVGLGWQDSRGWLVELGDMTEDFGLKLQLYETISNWLLANNIQPVLVNVAYPHAPYYRTEP
jgi:cell division septal protein FtsQ